MDSPKDLKWTVLKSKMNGQKSQNGRFKKTQCKIVDSLLDQNLAAIGDKSRRSVKLGLGFV